MRQAFLQNEMARFAAQMKPIAARGMADLIAAMRPGTDRAIAQAAAALPLLKPSDRV